MFVVVCFSTTFEKKKNITISQWNQNLESRQSAPARVSYSQ